MKTSTLWTPCCLAVLLGCLLGGCADTARAHRNIAALKHPSAATRISAIRDMALHATHDFDLSGWQSIQDLSLGDEDDSVRATALQALGDIAQYAPDKISQPGFGQHNVWQKLDLARLTEVSLGDPSPDVRLAAAGFWRQADVAWKDGIDVLSRLIKQDTSDAVINAAKASLSDLLAKCFSYGEVSAEDVHAYQQQCGLGTIPLQGGGRRPHTYKFIWEYIPKGFWVAVVGLFVLILAGRVTASHFHRRNRHVS
jgi:hypothetical protein